MRKTIQDHLFEEVLATFPKKSLAIESLSDLFGIGKDAVYRRVRGDTPLTPEELTILARKFNLSLDSYVYKESNTVFCSFNTFYHEIKDIRSYLEGIHGIMSKVKDLPNTKMYYATSDIPLFTYFFFPEILNFKFYIWGKTIWNIDYMEEMPFDFDIIPIPAQELAKDMLSYYISLDSVELLDTNILDNTLNQIEYYANSGRFKKTEDALLLCDRMTDLTNHLQAMAKRGEKFLPGTPDGVGRSKLALYHNEMIYTNNTILFDSVAGKAIYTSYTNPNFLKINDQRLCDFTANWIERIRSKSVLISEQGEQHRERYFNLLRRKVERTRHRIEVQMDLI